MTYRNYDCFSDENDGSGADARENMQPPQYTFLMHPNDACDTGDGGGDGYQYDNDCYCYAYYF